MSTAEIILAVIAVELALMAYMLWRIHENAYPRITIEADERYKQQMRDEFIGGRIEKDWGPGPHPEGGYRPRPRADGGSDTPPTSGSSVMRAGSASEAAHTATAAEDSATDAVEEAPERMVFGGMSEDERRARRRARRIASCTHEAVRDALPKLDDAQTAVACAACTGVADIIREDGKHARLGEFT